MREPQPHPFLSARDDVAAAQAAAVVAGFATDGGVSFRSGAARGPEGIRAFSESIETYSPRLDRDLEDLVVADAGDYAGGHAGVQAAAAELLDRAWSEAGRPLVCGLGGDHSVTPGLVRAVAERSERLVVVGFDAHLDLRVDYPGDHACTYRRITEAGVPCIVLGPRSGARSEWREAGDVLHYLSPGLEIPAPVMRWMHGRDVYLTIDIDVLDPSQAPGTGNPEAGGPTFAELSAALAELADLRVVAFDVVEVSPPLDPSGITQAAAALLVRETILRHARP